jgi:NAD(P)-dependent dehydrogenase (short-subunit alcohol dehydrogenase family)
MHGLMHWLPGTYAKKGITVNGVAPALIGATKMPPRGTAKSWQKVSLPHHVLGDLRCGPGYLWERNEKITLAFAISALADTVNANTSTGIPLGVVGRPDEIAEMGGLDGEDKIPLPNKVVIVGDGMLP